MIEMRKYCYDLTDDNNVIDFQPNNINKTIIDVTIFGLAPHNFYHVLNETHYQFCGPILLVGEYFAKFSGSR